MRVRRFAHQTLVWLGVACGSQLVSTTASAWSCGQAVQHLTTNPMDVARRINDARVQLNLLGNFGLSTVQSVELIEHLDPLEELEIINVVMVGQDPKCNARRVQIPNTDLSYTVTNRVATVSMEVAEAFRNMRLASLMFAHMLFRNPLVNATSDMLIDTNLYRFMSQLAFGDDSASTTYGSSSQTRLAMHQGLANQFQTLRLANPDDANTIQLVRDFRARLLAAIAATPHTLITSAFNFNLTEVVFSFPVVLMQNFASVDMSTGLNSTAVPRVIVKVDGIRYAVTPAGRIELSP